MERQQHRLSRLFNPPVLGAPAIDRAWLIAFIEARAQLARSGGDVAEYELEEKDALPEFVGACIRRRLTLLHVDRARAAARAGWILNGRLETVVSVLHVALPAFVGSAYAFTKGPEPHHFNVVGGLLSAAGALIVMAIGMRAEEFADLRKRWQAAFRQDAPPTSSGG